MSDPAGTPAPVTRRLVVSGRVQGVGYRAFLTREARAAGVAGWVRNRRDGTVEAVVQGNADAVERVIARARLGPPAGRVDDLQVQPAEGGFEGFTTRPTE
jgi:acylphosphatase